MLTLFLSLSQPLPAAPSHRHQHLNLSGIAERITKIIHRIRKPIDQVIDKVIDFVTNKVKKIAGKLLGKDKDKAKDKDKHKEKAEDTKKDFEKDKDKDKVQDSKHTYQTSFSMSGEGHRLKATVSEDGGVSVIMASVEGDLLAKINAEITQQIELSETSNNKQTKKQSRKAATQLRGIKDWFNASKDNVVKSKDQIAAKLQALIEELKSKIISVANEFGLKDLVYDAFDLKTPLLIIQK